MRIPNALKGLVIADDDQFALGVALISTWGRGISCNIHVMDISDADTVFHSIPGIADYIFSKNLKNLLVLGLGVSKKPQEVYSHRTWALSKTVNFKKIKPHDKRNFEEFPG